MHICVVGNFAEWLINFRGPMLMDLVRRGHRVTACAPNASSSVRMALADMGVNYVSVGMRRDGMHPLEDVRYFFTLYRLFRRIKPDVFWGYTVKPVVYGSVAAWFAGVPYRFSMIEGLGFVFTDHPDRRPWLRWMVMTLYALSLRCNQGVFFLNTDDEALFKSCRIIPGSIRSTQIGGIGVDLSHYTPTPLPEQTSFVFIARLIADKGVREYVAAARCLKQSFPDARFLLVGWLDENPASIRQAELDEWQADGIIEYLGKLDDIRPAMTMASVFVLPSYYREGLPRTLQEAMAMGRPVITTDLPGCRETVTNGVNGYAIPARDANALIAAMRRFLTEPEQIPAMGAAGRKMAEKRYDVYAVNRRMRAAMQSVLPKGIGL